MRIVRRKINGVYEIKTPPLYIDKRGSLHRVFDMRIFQEHRINVTWVQQSFSYTKFKGVLRGFHLQRSPFTEAKLITILKGEMYWVVIDVRKDSSTFGKWDAIILSKDDINNLFVERGFAHGCLSLTDDCNLIINADNYYSHDYGIGIAWNDPDLNINWPVEGIVPIISDEHRAHLSFNSFKTNYGGI